MSEDRIFQEAVGAVENGQRARARDLFTRILKKEPGRVDCWLYMSAVVETHKERAFCLENVLKYDPENATARQGLVMLSKLPPAEDKTPVRPLPTRPREEAQIYTPEPAESPRPGRPRQSAMRQSMPVVVVVLAAAALVYVGIFGLPFSGLRGFLIPAGPATPTFAPLAAAGGPTPTRQPTEPAGTPTLVSSIVLPTPLTIRLEQAYTPTPAYVNTPHPNNEAFMAALRSFEFGEYGTALGLFEQARSQMRDNNESDLDARYYIGLIYLEQGEYEDARREFDQILLQDEGFAAAYIGRARAILSMRASSVVAGDLYKAVGLDLEYVDGYLMIAEYRMNRGEPEEALWAIDQLLAIAPENARGLHFQAEALLAIGEVEAALEAAEQSFALDMTDIQHYKTYGHALVVNGREKEGFAYLDLYLREEGNENDAEALYLYGRALQGYNDHVRAVQTFEQAYALRRDIYPMSHYWAVSLVAIGEYERALNRVQVPIERIPNWYEPYLVKAQALYYLEDYAEAKEVIEVGADLARTDLQMIDLYYWRGLIYEELGFPAISKTNWSLLLEMDPQIVPPNYLIEAQKRLLPDAPTYTPAAPTQTRVPSQTPTP
jgi:tetratricopeptide (TPR) repeat protein